MGRFVINDKKCSERQWLRSPSSVYFVAVLSYAIYDSVQIGVLSGVAGVNPNIFKYHVILSQ